MHSRSRRRSCMYRRWRRRHMHRSRWRCGMHHRSRRRCGMHHRSRWRRRMDHRSRRRCRMHDRRRSDRRMHHRRRRLGSMFRRARHGRTSNRGLDQDPHGTPALLRVPVLALSDGSPPATRRARRQSRTRTERRRWCWRRFWPRRMVHHRPWRPRPWRPRRQCRRMPYRRLRPCQISNASSRTRPRPGRHKTLPVLDCRRACLPRSHRRPQRRQACRTYRCHVGRTRSWRRQRRWTAGKWPRHVCRPCPRPRRTPRPRRIT